MPDPIILDTDASHKTQLYIEISFLWRYIKYFCEVQNLRKFEYLTTRPPVCIQFRHGFGFQSRERLSPSPSIMN